MLPRRQINIDALERANGRLGRFIALYVAVGNDRPEYDAFLAAVIKGFEFAYGQAINAIRRYVADYVLSPGQVGQMPLPDITRMAAKNGLIGPPERWFDFRDWRNETAHEYFDDESAEKIASTVSEFHIAVAQLITTLQERLR